MTTDCKEARTKEERGRKSRRDRKGKSARQQNTEEEAEVPQFSPLTPKSGD